MIKTLCARLKQGYRTMPFPADTQVLPERFLGRPSLPAGLSPEERKACVSICPTAAIREQDAGLTLDMGTCLFCGACRKMCSPNAVQFSRDYCLAAEDKSELLISSVPGSQERKIKNTIKHIFGRSLKLRQVSAGGCNACEADINVLNTLSFDLGRFGIQFVASPRHADGIVVTGPVTKNMRLALEKTCAAVPSPKLVIAVGACAISGGLYQNHSEVHNGVDSIIPVDLYIPGCPPHPLTILDGLLKLMRRH